MHQDALRELLETVHEANSPQVRRWIDCAISHSPSSTAEVLSAAFRAAKSGRPGSAFVSLPIDAMTGDARCKPIRLSTFVEQGAESSLREAARLINSAKSPVTFLGLMASKPNCAHAIRNPLRTMALPVVGTFQAAGAVSLENFRL
jgi:acetolactate synthase-1/2/3 large subunit